MRETLEPACDDSSRPKVEAMFHKIVAKAAADTKSQATNVFEKYQSSFQVEPVSLLVQNVTEAFRLRGRNLLDDVRVVTKKRHLKKFTSLLRKFRQFS